METKLCKHCKSEIAKDAKVCPNCRKKQGGKAKWIIVGVIIVLIVGIVNIPNDDSKPSDSNPQKAGQVDKKDGDEKKENNDNTFSVGDIVETSDLKIKFLSAEEYDPNNDFLDIKEGYVFYKFEFEFENTGDSDNTISTLADWNCYADDYKMEQSWIGDDDLDGTISPGKKMKGSVYFKVPKYAKSITVEYETSFWTDDKVVFKVK